MKRSSPRALIGHKKGRAFGALPFSLSANCTIFSFRLSRFARASARVSSVLCLFPPGFSAAGPFLHPASAVPGGYEPYPVCFRFNRFEGREPRPASDRFSRSDRFAGHSQVPVPLLSEAP